MSFQSLILNNVRILGYNHQNNFFGEKSFQYSTTKNISIRGYVLDLTNSFGVKKILLETQEIKGFAGGFQNIIINGVNFGTGKFTSLSFDAGNWVRSTEFSADLEIYETANLQNLTSKEFTASNYFVSLTADGSSPNLLGFKFYKTGLITNSRPIYYDTTNTYALWSVGATWRVTLISNVGSTFAPRFSFSSTPSTSTPFTAPVATYGGLTGFTGNITLSIDNNYVLNLSANRMDLIKSLSESFNLDFDINNKILGGTHSIDLEYNADNQNLNVISLAQRLAAELLNKSIPESLSEYNYSVRQQGTYKILNNESYDIINGRCGFQKTFLYSTKNTLKPYSVSRNLNINLDLDGVATVSETCDIKAENDKPSLYENTVVGLDEEISQAYPRCSGLFFDYKDKLNITRDLNDLPLQKNIRIDKVNGTINYGISFNNSQKVLNNTSFEYTLTLDRDENYVYTVSENGSIKGLGAKIIIGSSNKRYLDAENVWNSNKNDIYNRVYELWENQPEKISNNLNLISEGVFRSPTNGEITYDYTFSDDPSIRNDLGLIKRLDIEFTDDGAAGNNLLAIYKEFKIPNQTYTLIQSRGLTRQGIFSIAAKAEIILPGADDTFNSLQFFDILKTHVRNLYLGGDLDKYLESVTFTSDEIEQVVTYSEIYKYS